LVFVGDTEPFANAIRHSVNSLRRPGIIASNIEAEGDDIFVFHDIILAFQAKPAGCFCIRQAFSAGHKILVTHDFRLDETPLEIFMNGSGCIPRSDTCRLLNLKSCL